MEPPQPLGAAFRQGHGLAGPLEHGVRHRRRVHGVEVQVGDPAGGLRGNVVLAQLRVVGPGVRLEDAAEPSHDGRPHVLVGPLISDEVDRELAGRVPQHGVPGGPRQRDVMDRVEPRLRLEGVPVALHDVRQGQDVCVEVAVVELLEVRPPHGPSGVNRLLVLLLAHGPAGQHAVVAAALPHRRPLPGLEAAEVAEGHGQLAQQAVPHQRQPAPAAAGPPRRGPAPATDCPAPGRGRQRDVCGHRRRRDSGPHGGPQGRAELPQLGVVRGHQREELRQDLWPAAQARRSSIIMLSTNLSGPQQSCRHFSPDLESIDSLRWL